MTEQQLRMKCINTAKSFLGRRESDGSHKEIIDIYNKILPHPRGYVMKYTDPWCAAFVSAISYLCGFLSIMPAECACDPMIKLYKNLGRWEENDAYDADLADVIFYDWQDSGVGDNVGSADHVGIIIGKDVGGFTVIEGNKNDAVETRYIKRNGRNIRGFGCPAYFVLSDENPEIPVEDGNGDVIIEPYIPPERPKCSVELDELTYGCGLNNPDDMVKAAQILLIGRKFPCGAAGDDGEFGDGTLMAVKNFQEENGLEIDGVIGSKTWSRLLGKK